MCADDLGFKGVLRVDGKLSFVPILGWITMSKNTPTGPDWTFEPVFCHPESFFPVHRWNLPGYICIVTVAMGEPETEAFIKRMEAKSEKDQASAQMAAAGRLFGPGGVGKA
jgi:hypothetical protein